MLLWEDLAGVDESAAFLTASWRELFDPYTPDTFQPRLHNVATLVDELVALASREGDASQWERRSRRLREELTAVGLEEKSLLEGLPEYQWLLEQLLASASREDSLRFGRLLCVRREEYDARVMTRLEASVADLPRHKKASHQAFRGVATLLLARGVDVESDFPEGPPATTTDLVARVVAMASPKKRSFECVFPVRGEARHLQKVARPVGFSLVKRDTLPTAARAAAVAQADTQFVLVQVESNSLRAAVAEGRRRLSRVTDLFNLYRNEDALVAHGHAFWRLAGGVDFEAYSESREGLRRLHPRRNAPDDTQVAIDSISSVQLERRLLSALELHSIALASTEPRLRLVNLWSALECLAGACEGRTVLQRVRGLVIDLLVWRRVEKVVRYLAIGCKRVIESSGGAADFGVAFERSTENYVHPYEVMRALCAPKNAAPVVELLRGASSHVLLRYRLYRAWEELHDPGRLATKLDLSRRRIDWQLQRIYRARNLVVHYGEEPPMLPLLLDNLQYYTSLSLQKVIHGMKLSDDWGVKESVAYWSAKSRYVVEKLRKGPHELTPGDFLLGAGEPRGEPLWPKATPDA
jgi:hypothetical protein